MNTEPNQPAAESHKCFSPEGMQAPTTAGMFRPLLNAIDLSSSNGDCPICHCFMLTTERLHKCWEQGHFDYPVYVDAAALVADQLDAMRESMIAKRTEDKISAAADFKPAPDSWIVFKYNAAPDVPEFQGIFTSEQAACGACHTSLHCVCPATMNVELDQTRRMWEGAYYPKRQQHSRNEVVGMLQTAMGHNADGEFSSAIVNGVEGAPMSMRLSDFEKEAESHEMGVARRMSNEEVMRMIAENAQLRALCIENGMRAGDKQMALQEELATCKACLLQKQNASLALSEKISNLIAENAELKKKWEGLDAALATQEIKFAQILVEKREQIEALQFSVAEAQRTEHKHCLHIQELLKEMDTKKYPYDKLLDKQRSSVMANIRLSNKVRTLKEAIHSSVEFVSHPHYANVPLFTYVKVTLADALSRTE